MLISDKTKKALIDLGLTNNEIKVYVSLLTHRYLTASELSQITKIPYSKIYEILVNLQNKGFVKVEESRPAKYYPIEPSIALENLKEKISQKINENVDIISKELAPLYEGKAAKEKSDVWLIRGKDEILIKIKDSILKCEYELIISLPTLDKTLQSSLSFLSNLRFKKIRTLILIGDENVAKVFYNLKIPAEIRIAGKMFGGGIIVDVKEVILFLPDEKEGVIALWSDHAGLANFAKQYFLYVWENSKKLSK